MAFLRAFTEAQYQGIMQVAEAFTMLERQGPYRKFRVAASGIRFSISCVSTSSLQYNCSIQLASAASGRRAVDATDLSSRELLYRELFDSAALLLCLFKSAVLIACEQMGRRGSFRRGSCGDLR
jgi:hypothetical protein